MKAVLCDSLWNCVSSALPLTIHFCDFSVSVDNSGHLLDGTPWEAQPQVN